ncbi:MAG: class 1 fructose-bisphosphatase [Calditrichaeota bacterium]|nr:class 1 fructose-bisphosphatase [Calditrichota bacterium]
MTTKIVTIQRHIFEVGRQYPQASGEFSGLLYDICMAAKQISYHVNKAGLMNLLGLNGEENVHGEQVKKLDSFAHETMVKALDHSGNLCVMASEEEEDIIQIPEKYPIGKYVCVFDPLDGSSNIDVNVSIGTIFSIHKRLDPESTEPGSLEDCCQPGWKQVCAGYVIYGSSTMLVYTTGNGVHGFTLDPSYGEFILSHENIQMPSQGTIYSVNESNFDYWDEGFKNYIRWVKKIDPETNRPRNSRYIGSLVADFHRNLLYGGVFCYPADRKSEATKSGKLRLLYEAAPMAFIAEQAGGRATTGFERILDIQPNSLHQRVPLIIGSRNDVKIVESFMRGEFQVKKDYLVSSGNVV